MPGNEARVAGRAGSLAGGAGSLAGDQPVVGSLMAAKCTTARTCGPSLAEFAIGEQQHSRGETRMGGESSWPHGIDAITLFVEDLETTKAFYRRAFGLPTHYEDDSSAVFNFGGLLINLLKVSEAPELIQPAAVADSDAGSRFQLTIGVEDVDAMCADLASRGVELLNGPIDRPWGLRTASFRDPAGHIWEIAH
jgi:catechol 2,3-dioxygenase-like lactoylglutathione lyase family enzyme